MSDSSKSYFPHNFLWGASTASHQVEGGNKNQWSSWEHKNAERLAKTAHQRYGHLPHWSEIKSQAENPQNYISGRGVDHYNRYQEDFDLLQTLNLNAFRFGIEWSRLEPEEGKWDEAAVKYYADYLKELNSRDIEPMLNIWHWTLPEWFADKGGFKYNRNLVYFNRFVQKIADEYGSNLTYIITLNEPNVYASFGYGIGEWPPQETNWITFWQVHYNLARAHRQAYKILKRANNSLQVGVATQLANIQSKRPHNFIDQLATKWMRYFWNWWFLNRIRRYQDFLGFNYYFTDYYQGLTKRNPQVPMNDLGWYMEPEGLYPLLIRAWAHYKKPIIITENGVADRHDQHRQWWLEESIIAMEKAISEGVDIRGYFHWSLLDNFEWAHGWWPKFGLVSVDRQNKMQRTPRLSALWLSRRIKELRH